jgi:hypothetical protein
VWPDTIETDDRLTFNNFASSLTTSSFAAPSTGGEDILTFKDPSISPAISLFEARGTTRTLNVTAPSFSVKWITVWSEMRSLPDEHVQD